EILFCIVEERGIYYIDKIELIQNRVEGVLVKEISNLQMDIPEFFAIDLYQKDAFYVLEKFYYNSKKPVILKIEFNIPTCDIKSKTISIYDEEKEILKKEVIFEKGEKLKEICFNIKGNKNLRVKVDDKELNMKIFDMKGLKEENLKIRKKRERTKNPFYRGIISAYAGTIYKKDDTVDIDAILSRIKELGVNCYTYLICYKSEKELKDLPEFLKKAKEEGIEVWVYIVPPSEAPIDRDKAIYERKYPPFDMDYLKWAEKIAEISLEYPNLTLWMIDDFDANLNFFTLDYTKKIYEKTKEINPKLLFGVCVYYDSIENFVKMGYLPYFDAILWGFQHSSIKFPDCGLKADSLSVEINDYYKLCPDKILIPCIYFTPHSSWPFGRPTREYLEKALEIAFNEAGICWIFTMPKPGTMQYEIVKNFTNRIELKKRKFE
ncbi:MAG: hypothetical protein NC926_07165, partial [Candidatus Omnitrophica bacterium]|nr:hypothetical protein [Candidatus Omnitrophota bacterium]